MDRKELIAKLEKPYFKSSVRELAKSINSDFLTKELILALNHPDIKVCSKAGWVLSNCCDIKNPYLVNYKEVLMAILFKTSHESVKRNILRFFQFEEVPSIEHATLFNWCMNLFLNRNEKPASRVFAVSILANISSIYPELKNEVILACNEVLVDGSAGIKNRISKVLNKLL